MFQPDREGWNKSKWRWKITQRLFGEICGLRVEESWKIEVRKKTGKHRASQCQILGDPIITRWGRPS